MTGPDVHCDFCDLPMSQCVHGLPPPAQKPAPKPAQKAAQKAAQKPATITPAGPRKQAAARAGAAAATDRPVSRRWTQPEAFKPLILRALQEAGGELDADELFLELEILADERLLPGDRETTPAGELRWQYAARRARLALIDEGLMTKGRPGVWLLAPPHPRGAS